MTDPNLSALSLEHPLLCSMCLLSRRNEAALRSCISLPASSQCRTAIRCGELLHPGLQLRAEVANKALNGPSKSFAKS
jgi:hypothetical protein